MSRLSYAEKLAALIEVLPAEAKRTLRLTHVAHLVSEGHDTPASLPLVYDSLKKSLLTFGQPEQVKALGPCLIKWWATIHGRAVTDRDLNHHFDELSETDVRERLVHFALECAEEKDTSGGKE